MDNQKIWFITGVSSGFGRELAKEVAAKGDLVIGSVRKESQIEEVNALVPENTFGTKLDVTNMAQVKEAIKQAFQRFGRIDVLVNNAGYGSIGSIEEVSEKEIRQQFEVNVFGALNVIRTVLPHLRKQKNGHIINITSIGGLIGSEGVGIYNGTKFALEGIGEALAAEVAPLGIKVSNVEPGPFRTNWAGKSANYTASTIEDYDATVGKRMRFMKKISGQQPGDPQKGAAAIYALTQLENTPLHFPLGEIAYNMTFDKLTRLKEEVAEFEYLGKPTDYNSR
ncbi:MAG: oxidoreductase [Bacteroidota bacterium]